MLQFTFPTCWSHMNVLSSGVSFCQNCMNAVQSIDGILTHYTDQLCPLRRFFAVILVGRSWFCNCSGTSGVVVNNINFKFYCPKLSQLHCPKLSQTVPIVNYPNCTTLRRPKGLKSYCPNYQQWQQYDRVPDSPQEETSGYLTLSYGIYMSRFWLICLQCLGIMDYNLENVVSFKI